METESGVMKGHGPDGIRGVAYKAVDTPQHCRQDEQTQSTVNYKFEGPTKVTRMFLNIAFLDTKHTLEVDPSITVGELKKRIQGLKLGLTGTCLKLKENGINFSDDSLKLRDIGLKSDAIISVLVTKPEPMQVFLRNEKGQTKTFDVMPGETVTSFKNKVYNKERVPVNQQRLIHEGKQLDDGRKLEDYNIVSGSTIHLTLRLRGG